MGLDRQEPAQKLVLALGAGVEPSEPVADAVLDQPVVADLEVQPAVVFGTAPVAPEEGVASHEAVGAGDVAAGAACEHHQRLVRERLRDACEERRGQCRVAPFPVVGRAVQRMVRVPLRLGGGAAVVDLDVHRGRCRVPALAPDFLAPLRGQRIEIVLKIPVAAVHPVKLAPRAHEQPAGLERGGIALAREQPVKRRRGHRLRHLHRAGRERTFHLGLPSRGVNEQPGAGRRSERNGGDELGVVLEPMARVRLGPGPVEDELPLRVQLEVGGGSADQPVARVHQEVRRDPPDLFADAAVAFQRIEKRVSRERVVLARERIPLRRRHVGDALEGGDRVRGGGVRVRPGSGARSARAGPHLSPARGLGAAISAPRFAAWRGVCAGRHGVQAGGRPVVLRPFRAVRTRDTGRRRAPPCSPSRRR